MTPDADGPPPQPELEDGVVVLRAWRDDDVEAAVDGQDGEIAHWFGWTSTPSAEDQRRAIDRWRAGYAEGRSQVAFVIEHDRAPVGCIDVRDVGSDTGHVSWLLFKDHRGRGFATRAIRLMGDYVLGELGLTRMEAKVEPGNTRSLLAASRAGMRREGIRRVSPGSGDRPETTEYVYLARLADDAPPTEPSGFRALLNASLPRKRAIAQMLIRDADDRVLLCALTYKRDWDLPGGVVEVSESPADAATREVEEELGLDVPAGPLVLADWLPPWGGWDDALCLVFDGGVHPAEVIRDAVLQRREIRDAQFLTLDEARERCADFTTRRLESALRSVADGAPASYTESGRARPPRG